MKEDEIDDISEKIDDASTGAEAHSTYVLSLIHISEPTRPSP